MTPPFRNHFAIETAVRCAAGAVSGCFDRTAPGIPGTSPFFNGERLLIDYGTPEVLTTMGVFMIANNIFNDALQVEPEGRA